VQDKTSHFFTQRIERLKFTLKATDDQLAKTIGVSRRMLYLMRHGKSKITAKTLWKIDQAEKAAGLSTHVPTVDEAIERIEKASSEDLEFYKCQNAAYRLKGLRDRLAKEIESIDSEIQFLVTPAQPIRKK
jgi:transcriptional regulator with XRE-family HTH domain